ncbi:MAG: 16S rRNA (guanine(527)-N(7))-methyltransferase RsmG [Rhizomicrobium sp.]
MRDASPPEAFGPAEFQAVSGVSRETLARLKLFVGLLTDWNVRMNLVSANSLQEVWRRHVWDSAQLLPFIHEDARSLVDLGSGAGFPGLVLAVMLAERPDFRTVLYESIAKKCRFLEEVAHRVGVAAEIRNARIEDATPEPFDLVTARACAPLTQLLSYAYVFQGKNTQCLFLKGRSVGAELVEANKSWTMVVEQHRSRSDPSGMILAIRELRHVTSRH